MDDATNSRPGGSNAPTEADTTVEHGADDAAMPLIRPFVRMADAGAKAFVTTRHGGVSPAPYASLNLGDHVGDDPEAVRSNRAVLAHALGLQPGALRFVDQVHGAEVFRVSDAPFAAPEHGDPREGDPDQGNRDHGDPNDGGRDHVARHRPPCADAMISDQPGVCLCILVADCVPILLFDPVTRSIGAAHAGWRGTVADIAGRTVAAMAEAYGARPADMLAAIGPSIGPRDFEVGPEVRQAFQEAYPERWRDLARAGEGDRHYIDLWRANALRLEAAGLQAARIEIAGISTPSRTRDFYSYRAEGGRTGRFAAGIHIPAGLD